MENIMARKKIRILKKIIMSTYQNPDQNIVYFETLSPGQEIQILMLRNAS